ncbi:response regulator [Kamptonema sp. UHCC 0994]|uniref:response regulator transcription factor n=1 Tax=Kamptonema sp. UHCC 0994 TaxID=3031329 RepID=UPI0023B928BB|nr:response regulator [Kamptonema sp. UHCC 0994]MDF0554863.1 response regulator [Kamptonema sp. UHCC 0994]
MSLILIADDRQNWRDLTRKAMIAENYQTVEANNGRECLEMISVYHPDCVILDIEMPEKDGFEVLETLFNQSVKIPVIVYSSAMQEITRLYCLTMGAAAFISKPATDSELRNAVKTALSKYKITERQVDVNQRQIASY